ncbi:hypothetical protein H6G33_09720 [Calothrix sp. FACHB-1219]|uniref:hypothetical protein n=1 Tax=unclassified Calothrix TaxID=2619626 RepID=UPI0016897141|nr:MULTISPECIES: hypothetical protein [unclassified Calothrix]MBD2201625.1 hypothetical protein [Calothrix sp. FACHB-168]MBD2217311.1 hypothetical protein [Calothrix sp. FACHB-1219]
MKFTFPERGGINMSLFAKLRAAANNVEVSVEAAPAKLSDTFAKYYEKGQMIVAINVGANEKYYERRGSEDKSSTPIVSNKMGIRLNQDGSVFVKGLMTGIFYWSENRKSWIAPPAVEKNKEGIEVPGIKSKPQGFIGTYMGGILFTLNDYISRMQEDGEIELAAKVEKLKKDKLTLSFMCQQEISFDLPCSHDQVIEQADRLRAERQIALDSGKKAGVLGNTLVLAITLEFSENPDAFMTPIVKVQKVLSWTEDYMPLETCGKLRVDGEMAEDLEAYAIEQTFNEKEAEIKAANAMAQAAINLLTPDEGGVAGTRTSRRTADYKRARRKQKQEQFLLNEAARNLEVEQSKAEVEEIDEDDMMSMSMGGI